MLRALFPRSGAIYEHSCFAQEMSDFCEWLRRAGYSKGTIQGHLRRLFKVLTGSHKLRVKDAYSSAVLHRVFGRHCTCEYLSHAFRATERAYRRFLRAQGRLREPATRRDAVAVLLRRYRQYLEKVRGFSEVTTEQHQQTVSEFFQTILCPPRRIRALTSEHVEQYLRHKNKHVSRQTMQHVVARLRAFFRYGAARGLIRAGLDTIDTPRTYREELPVRALPWSLVNQLLRSIDLTSKGGWRDYTILHLMAHYGLRPSEIVALRVDSIDWRAKTCRVEQRKTQSDLVLPLSGRTVRLLRRYLYRGRYESKAPQLFLRARRPFGRLQHYAVCNLFYKRAAQSGLPLEGYSSYSLRHAFAMRLLQRGVGVKAIGDLLGHRSLEATCVYLRLDVSALRAVALPMPSIRPSQKCLHA
jgi:integrase/recombinase XerD